MRRDRTRVLLVFEAPPDRQQLSAVLTQYRLTLEDVKTPEGLGRPLERINQTPRRLWVRSIGGGAIGDDALEELRSALEELELAWLAPVYIMPTLEGLRARLSPLPAVIMIEAARGQDERLIGWMAERGWREVPEKSRFLPGYRYFVTDEPDQTSAYEIRERLQQQPRLARDVRLEHMPLIQPTALVPNDPMYAQQWDMEQINAQAGWDIEAGSSSVVVCVLDTGCDLTHPDLEPIYASGGINLDTMSGDGSPTENHGTACAGIAVAVLGNEEGIAGVAGGGCRLLPAAVVYWTESEIAGGINYARTEGARVISMSFGWDAWDPTMIDLAIQAAYEADLVMCVATHNYDSSITYPATNPLVMACGASDQVDDRKSPTSPDGEPWGSNFGPEMSVVAPGVLIPTTDRQGTDGYNGTTGAGGDYFDMFNGTSSATPHVAGLAALLLSHYPTLTNDQVRSIIERTAVRVGTVPYDQIAGYPHGPWNEEMGYGRIDVMRALDFADVMIRDYGGDTGEEPSSPPGGNFWRFSHVVVRIFDDDVFVPSDPSKSSSVERGQTNYLYVEVTNNGPREANDVTVDARIVPWVGTQFMYPQDWTLTDTMHVAPAPLDATFTSIPAGGSVIAKFSISAAQVEALWGWVSMSSWHPCLLARVLAGNDYAFQAAIPPTGGGLVTRYNDLAQRNLSVIDVIAGATATLPFIAGHVLNMERVMELVVDRRGLPEGARLMLSLDEDGSAFPRVDFTRGGVLDPNRVPPTEVRPPTPDECGGGVMFLDRSRLSVSLCSCSGILTLEPGSRFDCMPPTGLEVVDIHGGELSVQGGRRMVRVTEDRAFITLRRNPGVMHPMALLTTVPADARVGDELSVDVAQRDSAGTIVGGAGVVYVVTANP